MNRLQTHLRNTFLAGILGFIPIVITVFIVYWIDAKTRWLTEHIFGRSIPIVGILLALALIYFTGLLATTLIGKALLKVLDALLQRLPFIKQGYTAWKQIALTPGGTEGTFSKVVMLLDESNKYRLIGFTSGRPVDADGTHICVFVPAAPNPTQGRLYFVSRDQVQYLDLSAEEVFKLILSTGNYIPESVRQALQPEKMQRPTTISSV